MIVNELSIFGKRFMFKDIVNENLDVYVYLPMISVISLEFRESKSKIRVEAPLFSVHSQNLPFDYITSQISHQVL